MANEIKFWHADMSNGSFADSEPTAGSDNLMMSGDIKTAIDKAAGSVLPAVTADDNGSILKVADGNWSKGNETVYTAATADTLGLVKQGAAVADPVGDAPTAAEYKALLDALRGAGIIATEAEESDGE